MLTAPGQRDPPTPVVPEPLVLIVEDNDVNLRLFSRVVRRCGARALEAASATAARELFSAQKESVSLLLVDQFLPDQLGVDLLQALRRQHPNLPALVISGSAVRLPPKTWFLLKPFLPDELEAILRKLLLTQGPTGTTAAPPAAPAARQNPTNP